MVLGHVTWCMGMSHDASVKLAHISCDVNDVCLNKITIDEFETQENVYSIRSSDLILMITRVL